MKLRAISMDEFDRWAPSLKVIAHDHARRFAAIELTKRVSVSISWRSDGIEPVVVVGNPSEIWIGVDQRLARVCDDGRIELSLGLGSVLLDIRCFPECTVVLCDIEALIFNRDCSVRAIRGLSELPCDVVQDAGELFVVFADGRRESLE